MVDKITSLFDRSVNLIYTGTTQIEEIVVITFTGKAADGLKVRFQEKLEAAWSKETNLDSKGINKEKNSSSHTLMGNFL